MGLQHSSDKLYYCITPWKDICGLLLVFIREFLRIKPFFLLLNLRKFYLQDNQGMCGLHSLADNIDQDIYSNPAKGLSEDILCVFFSN